MIFCFQKKGRSRQNVVERGASANVSEKVATHAAHHSEVAVAGIRTKVGRLS